VNLTVWNIENINSFPLLYCSWMLVSREIKNLLASLGFLSFAYVRCTASEEDRKEGSVLQTVRLSVTQTFQITQVKLHAAILFFHLPSVPIKIHVILIPIFQTPPLYVSCVFSIICFVILSSSYSCIFSFSRVFHSSVSNKPSGFVNWHVASSDL